MTVPQLLGKYKITIFKEGGRKRLHKKGEGLFKMIDIDGDGNLTETEFLREREKNLRCAVLKHQPNRIISMLPC